MNIEQENKQREQAKNLTTEVGTYIPSELARLELGQELSFEKGLFIIENFIQFYRNLSICDFNAIPIQKIQQITNEATNAKNILEQIKGFSLQKYANNPIGTRDQFLNTLQQHYSTSFDSFSKLIDYFKPKESVETYGIAAKQALDEINSLKSELLKDKEKTSKELTEILETARQTVSKIGVASHAIHFKNEADEHLEASRKWLIALSIAVCLTIGWGIACFYINPTGNSSQEIIQFTIAKIIIISGLYYTLSAISKNYKAHRHNFIVNRHKQNSLNSFEAFVKGAGEDLQTKNAVLISATQSIFSAQATGYSNQEQDSEPSKIIEILKTTQQTK